MGGGKAYILRGKRGMHCGEKRGGGKGCRKSKRTKDNNKKAERIESENVEKL